MNIDSTVSLASASESKNKECLKVKNMIIAFFLRASVLSEALVRPGS